MNVIRGRKLLIVIALCGAAFGKTFGDTETVDGITWTYTVSAGQASVGGGSASGTAVPRSSSGAIVIPSTLGGCPVTSVGSWAFSGCSGLTSVTMPSSLTSIGDYAFYDCGGLTLMTIAAGVTNIGTSAFGGCSGLTSVTMPSRLMCIGDLAFQVCRGLTSVTIPSSVTSIGESAFVWCSGLTSVTMPSSVTNVGGRAFYGCSGLARVDITDLAKWCEFSFSSSDANPLYYAHHLYLNGEEVKDLAVPSSVARIGERAFSGCAGLTSVSIPLSVTSIGSGAFAGCSSLTNMVLPFVGANRGNAGSVDSLFGYIFGSSSASGMMSIKQYYSSASFCEYYIPSTLKSVAIMDETVIGYGAFYGCSMLEAVLIPSSVTSIGDRAFYGCKGLTRVDITDLAKWCEFSFCGSDANPLYYAHHLYLNGEEVKDLIVPPSVARIGDRAFYGCSGLTSVTIPPDVTSVGYCAFDGCSGLTSVMISPGVTNIGDSAFCNCVGMESLTMPASVSRIGSYAFNGCNGLLSVTIPSCVEKLSLVFQGAYSAITNVVICDGVTSVADDAFSGCSELRSVGIPVSVTSIGSRAFFDCSELTSIAIPSSVTCVASSAFCGCSGLTSVMIPSSVTSIEDRAFYGCSMLTSVTIPTSVTRVGEWAFYGCSGLTSVEIPSSVMSMGISAFSGCVSITNMTLPFVGARRGNVGTPDSLFGYIFGRASSEGALAVLQCYTPNNSSATYYIPESLKSVTITDENTLGHGAFYNCSGLTYVGLPKCLTNIGDNAFCNCSELTLVVVPSNVTSVGASAFCGCSRLSGVMLSECLESVGGSAFEGCSSLSSIRIPSSVTSVGSSAFSGCSSLKTVEVADVGMWCGIAFGDASANPMSITHGFCVDGVAVTDLEVPDGVMSIGNYAFYGCSELKSVSISESVKRIGASAFSGCSGLTSLVIPSSITQIGASAFYNCTGLVSATIPVSVTSIGSSAFSGCSGLTSVTIPACVSKLSTTFPNAYGKMKSVVIDDGVTSIGSSEFSGCSALTAVSVPESVRSIGSSAFKSCTSLVDVSIPSNVTQVGANAFSGCDALPDDDEDGYVVIDGRLVGCRPNAAAEINGLDEIVEVVGGALTGCKSIERLEFSPASVLKHVGDEAFKECTELRSMTLPSSLKTIGREAFMGCSYLDNVIVPGSVSAVGARAFKNCTGFSAALIEHGVTSIGEECFYGDWRIAEVDLPSTVASIGLDAFGGDSSIVRVGLRGDCRSVKTIFSNYAQIKEATVRSGNGKIVSGLFSGCSALKVVHFQGNAPQLADTTIYEKTPSALVTYVEPTSTGWDGTMGSHALPQSWPLSGSYRRSIAYWDVPTYLCQFDSNGGSLGVQDTYQYSEKKIALPPEPVQSGYKFAGWWTQPIGGLRVTEDTIFIEGVYTYLWAHWVKGHTVFLDPNGGVVINGFVTYVDESVYGVLPTPVRSGYAFDGWLYNNEKIRPDTKINEMADHTLIAQWTANKYKVKYHPNGGVGGDVVEDWVYGEVGFLRRNSFVREGFEFLGWATSEDGDVVIYADGQSVSNLQTEEGAVSELWAVWRESDAVDPTNVELVFGGNADWEKVYRIVSTQIEDHVVNTPVLWQSGRIADNEHSDMKARVFGGGTIGFWWKVSCEKFRKEKLDHLSFSIDGSEKDWINGKTEWAYAEFRVDEVEPHEFVWSYAKDGVDSDGEDCGFVCAVVWIPRLETLEDYAGTTNLALVTSGVADWYGVTNVTCNRSGCVRSGKIADGQESRLEAIAEGEGVVEYWWKTDCERFRDYKIDRVAFYVDGTELAWTNGVTDWHYQRFKVSGEGAHTLSWVYIKDEEGRSGEDCAWVSEINWIPAGAEVAVPSVIGDDNAIVTGDAETGFVIKPSEGKTAVEVTIPQGEDAAKVTVEVSVKVVSVKPNGAKVKVVNAGADITEFLNVPAADGNGVVDLTKATVKEEIVKEVLDPAKGAKIKLNAANPTLITPNTRVGLFYQLREGTTLEGMSNGDSTIGDGNPWKPEIKVKGGNSAFYSIGVGKGE